MARALFTGSSLSRVKRCHASAVLPQVASDNAAAAGGDVVHEHLALRVTHGMDYAVEALPRLCSKYRLTEEDAGFATSKCMGFEWTPPAGALCEVSLALFADGHVERVRGGRGEYDLPEGAIFAATLDAVWAEPAPLQWEGDDDSGCFKCQGTSVLWVGDYKAGKEEYVEQVEHNSQLRSGALLAARWTGAKVVMPAIIFVRKGPGEWDTPARALGPADLDEIETEIRYTYQQVQQSRSALEQGIMPPQTEGHWCQWCPAQSRCPAKTAMIRAALDGNMMSTEQLVAGLTVEQTARLAAAIPQLEAFVRRGKAVLKQIHAEQGDIDLGGGVVWGPHEKPTKVIDPDLGAEILAQEIGHEAAAKAVKKSLSQDAIKAAVKDAHEKAGITRKQAPTVRRVMAKLIEQGGLHTETEVWWSAHRPRAAAAGEEPAEDAEIDE